MKVHVEIEAIAKELNLSTDDLRPEMVGALAFVVAAMEMAGKHEMVKERAALLQAFIGVVVSARPTLVTRLSKRFSGARSADWLAAAFADAEAREAFPAELFVAGLTALVPFDRSDNKDPWTSVDAAAAALGVDIDFANQVQGWLRGSASTDLSSRFHKRKEHWASLNATTQRFAECIRPIITSDGSQFLNLRATVLSTLDELEPYLQDIGVTRIVRNELRDYLRSDCFRLTVIGEFKRGKSTLINALLACPDLMPAATLPCTSALTEIRHGDQMTFEVSHKAGLPGTFEPSDVESFRKGVARARELRYNKADASEAAERVPFWQVRVPSEFLGKKQVAIIDSPGLGEDYARQIITKNEAKRADAAILVFDATQLASLEELDLIEAMSDKINDIFIVVNKVDLVDPVELLELEEYLFERINPKERSTKVSPDHVKFVSAAKAHRALVEQRPDDPHLAQLEELRNALTLHLIRHHHGIRLKSITQKTSAFIESSYTEIAHHVSSLKAKIQDINAHEHNVKISEGLLRETRRDVARAVEILKDTQTIKERLFKVYNDGLPGICSALDADKENWTSEHNPMSSPKKHTQDIVNHAQKNVEKSFEKWVNGPATETLSACADEKISEVAQALDSYATYINHTSGESKKVAIDRLRDRVINGAFGEFNGVSSGAIVGRTIVGSVLTVAIGYAISDVILYYILGAVVGFLNPIILAGAVLAAIPVALFGGTILRGWIRNKVAEETQNLIKASEATSNIKRGLDDGVETFFERLAFSFECQAQASINEAEFQEKRTRETQEEYIRALKEDPMALRHRLEAVERSARSATDLLDKLREALPATPEASA